LLHLVGYLHRFTTMMHGHTNINEQMLFNKSNGITAR